jgi:hypothetical protein
MKASDGKLAEQANSSGKPEFNNFQKDIGVTKLIFAGKEVEEG